MSPALSGAVDLSALKQRAQQSGPEGSAGAGRGARGVEVTEANFENEVLLRSAQVPVVVVLWSPRSDACVRLIEAFASLAGADNGKWALATVDVDSSPRVAQLFGVDAVPTVIALAGGQPIASFQGVQPLEQLRRWVDSMLSATAGKLGDPADSDNEPVDPLLEEARRQLDSGDLASSSAAYQKLLDADPNHVEAKGALKQIRFLERATTQPHNAIEAANAAPDNIEAAFSAADVEILSQDVGPAFDRLIALIRKTSGDERSKVRTRLIELLELFDSADPVVIAARRNLANALY
jgi:putative thioredoxin